MLNADCFVKESLIVVRGGQLSAIDGQLEQRHRCLPIAEMLSAERGLNRKRNRSLLLGAVSFQRSAVSLSNATAACRSLKCRVLNADCFVKESLIVVRGGQLSAIDGQLEQRHRCLPIAEMLSAERGLNRKRNRSLLLGAVSFQRSAVSLSNATAACRSLKCRVLNAD